MTKQEKSTPPTVELVTSRYQPSKSELEADVRLMNGKPLTLQGLAKAVRRVAQPVEVRWVRKPRQ